MELVEGGESRGHRQLAPRAARTRGGPQGLRRERRCNGEGGYPRGGRGVARRACSSRRVLWCVGGRSAVRSPGQAAVGPRAPLDGASGPVFDRHLTPTSSPPSPAWGHADSPDVLKEARAACRWRPTIWAGGRAHAGASRARGARCPRSTLGLHAARALPPRAYGSASPTGRPSVRGARPRPSRASS